MTVWGPLPASGAWRHVTARDGVEVALFSSYDEGTRISGSTAAVEEGAGWAADYVVDVDARWRTRRGVVRMRSAAGERTVSLAADGNGRWTIDDVDAPHLDGCLDIDLEASAVTNALPVHRLELAPGESADAPAVYVRVDGSVERLGQTYRRTDERRFDYAAPVFHFTCTLTYDAAGLVIDYPGIATRLA